MNQDMELTHSFQDSKVKTESDITDDGSRIRCVEVAFCLGCDDVFASDAEYANHHCVPCSNKSLTPPSDGGGCDNDGDESHEMNDSDTELLKSNHCSIVCTGAEGFAQHNCRLQLPALGGPESTVCQNSNDRAAGENGVVLLEHSYSKSPGGSVSSGAVSSSDSNNQHFLQVSEQEDGSSLKQKHVSEVESSAKRKYTCTLCSKSFHYRVPFQRHVATHCRNPTDRTRLVPPPPFSPSTERDHESKPLSPLHVVVDYVKGSRQQQQPTLKAASPAEKRLKYITCAVCQKFDFVRKSHYEKHIRWHVRYMRHLSKAQLTELSRIVPDIRLNQCEVCCRMFDTKQLLFKHMNKPKKCRAKRLKCSLCKDDFESHKKLRRHKALAHKGHVFQCRYCEQGFPARNKLILHTRKMHPKLDSYDCTQCGKSYKSRGKLVEHIRLHTGEKPFSCSVCKKTFRVKASLAQHMVNIHKPRSHDSVSPPPTFQCTQCDKAFKTQHGLSAHVRRHTSERPFLCTLCGLTFKFVSDLKRHSRRHGDQGIHQCTLCPRQYREKRHLINHIAMHDPKNRLTCAECGAVFTRRDSYELHLRKHRGERPYPCEQCDGAFMRPIELKRHVRSKHTKDKPYHCPHCAKSFYFRYLLRTHLHIHTGEPHKCNRCQKYLRSRSVFDAHKRQLHANAGEAFKCIVCDQEFSTMRGLQLHRLIHTRPSGDIKARKTSAPAEQCDACVAGFTSKDDLSAHVASHHRTDQPRAVNTAAVDVVKRESVGVMSSVEKAASAGAKSSVKKTASVASNSLVCTHCTEEFTDRALYLQHLRAHVAKSRFMCAHCDRAFTIKSYLEKHIRDEHSL